MPEPPSLSATHSMYPFLTCLTVYLFIYHIYLFCFLALTLKLHESIFVRHVH